MKEAQAKPKPKPVERKEVVETSLWGEVVVRRLMLTDRLSISVPTPDSVKQRTDESEAEHRKRNDREYGTFLVELAALAVTDKEGEPLYTAPEWSLWATDEKAAADTTKVIDRALAINGFRTLTQEDVPKNA